MPRTLAIEPPVDALPFEERVLALTTDLDGVVTWCSPALEGLLGWSSEELVGRPVPRRLFDAQQVAHRMAASGLPFGPALFLADPRHFDRRRVQVDLGGVDRRGRGSQTSSRPAACDWTLVTREGRSLVVSVTVSSMHDATGTPTGYLAIGLDVTEERRTRRLLAVALEREQEALRRMEELDRLRNEFVSGASHELRTPLTAILGYLSLVSAHVDGSSTGAAALEGVRRNVARIEHLADELLILASVGADHDEPAEALDVNDVVRGAADMLESLGDTSSRFPLLELAEGPLLVVGRQHQLERVLRHLVDNALKFSEPDAPVRCRTFADGDQVVLEVSDTGTGIPDVELPFVLDRFFRGDQAVRNGLPGAGLGLSVVDSVVRRHGGSLHITTNTPRGTVVQVRLPRADSA